ncbi:hypothetical protein GPECTOR_59g617 [Gonium pectorale]|uniref:Photolyase/cryptochrome alpha/beta domain-containing protein n=1 Tax=Gonium pectorale TaxID=33097 RepID=A0A150G6P7_GONPE|nr:hypothetical protein GPECTOR_59g617 [Gonium pectorale]|eukprot:KXZ45010.1 hypothetical protein GPECTOR_59g617 [Gonium pectorale]
MRTGSGAKGDVSGRLWPSVDGCLLARALRSALPNRLNGIGGSAPVVLWFRNDLRVDDHPGLTAAAEACLRSGSGAGSASGPRPLLPVFLLDPERLSYLAFSPGGPEALSAALRRLRDDLRSRGSDLAVRVGPWTPALAGLAAEAGGGGGGGGAASLAAVVSEDEVEFRWRAPAAAALDQLYDDAGVVPYSWSAPLWPAARFAPRYREWRQARGPPAEPLPPPASLPPFPAGLDPDYCVAEPASPLPGAPAVLLVHGFGAFGDQWRGNMGALAAAGFRVFAPTFPGFGRSQKAAVPYSQDLWRDFLRDFTLQVVGRPVVVAGNSIGGFISTCLAADCPGLVRGLVLLNSAGPIDASFDPAAWRAAVAAGRRPPPAVIVSAVSSALFWYLERTVPSTLKWLYPTNPAKADEWLQQEILRAGAAPARPPA